MDHENLTTSELAEYLRLDSIRTPMRWRQHRTGPPWVKAGGRVLYRKSDVDAWLEANRQAPVREATA